MGHTGALVDLGVKIFIDSAMPSAISKYAKDPLVRGFTTNPTLMSQAKVSSYFDFAHSVLSQVDGKPTSFEVFGDDDESIESEAKKIASWGDNVYVKIPVTTTRGTSNSALIGRLSQAGVRVNVTAVFTHQQVSEIAQTLSGGASSIISVFAGRIADTGRDPIPHMRQAKKIIEKYSPDSELLWASPREVLNVRHAEESGTDIITIQPALLEKAKKFGRDLNEFSLETVRMFFDDAQKMTLDL